MFNKKLLNNITPIKGTLMREREVQSQWWLQKKFSKGSLRNLN